MVGKGLPNIHLKAYHMDKIAIDPVTPSYFKAGLVSQEDDKPQYQGVCHFSQILYLHLNHPQMIT